MKTIEKIIQKKWFVYVFFGIAWALIFTIYFPAYKALLIDDGISGIWELKTEGFKGFLNSYGFDSFYYGHYAIIAGLYFLFGTNPLGWFIVFTGMHALNSTLILSTSKKIYQLCNFPNQAIWISLMGALLFLLSPYQSENIIWGATSHYFTAMLILWLGLNWLLEYVSSTKQVFSIFLFHALFAFSLLTLELSFLFPVLFGLLYILLMIYGKNRLTIISYFLKILLPQIVIVAIYLICYKWKVGQWIPHDRAPIDAQVSIGYMISTLSQHIMKLFGFVHMLNATSREWVYALAIHWKKAALVLGLIFTIISTWVFFVDRKKLAAIWFFLIAGIILYLPFVRVYFMYFNRFENDRYTYFASAFLLQFFVILLFQTKAWIRIIVYLSFLVTCIYFVFPAVKARTYSAKLYTTYLYQFPENKAGKTYIMNVPAYCADAYVFRARTRLPISYQAIFNQDIFDKIQAISWYNAQTNLDTFEVKKLDALHYEMILKTNGSWWMAQSIGASNYENDDYVFRLGEWGNYYLEFKHPLSEHDALIYFNGKRFVKMN